MRVADVCCCAGGAGYGYSLAGFEVTGVDIDPQPSYPFAFIQADALEFLDSLSRSDFDLIHASPPCQAYSPLNAYNKVSYPDLVAPVRTRLKRLGIPYVIENVVQAPLRNPVILCGQSHGLKMYRHRGFECSFSVRGVMHGAHIHKCARNGYLPTVERPYMSIHGGKHSRAWLAAAKTCMGIEWVSTIREICEAIPPAYTEYIGREMAR